MHTLTKRILSFFTAAALLMSFAGCESRVSPYVSRPQDSMVLYEKDGGVYLTNTDAASYTAEGSQAGRINVDIVPLASGSAYYLEDDTLYYKNYLEPAYRMTDGVRTVFYAIGSVFAVTHDGRLLRTDDNSQYEEVLAGLSLDGAAPFVECGNTIYVAAGGALYRLFYGGAPEKIKTYAGELIFLTGNAEEVYFAADGAVWKCGHKSIASKRLSGSGSVTPILPETAVSYAKKLFWTNDAGTLSVYDISSRQTIDTDLHFSAPKARLLPQGASDAEALVITDGEKHYAYFFADGKILPLEQADWVYAAEGILYGFRDGALVIADGEKVVCTDGYERTFSLVTPDGYYFLTGPEEGYQAVLWALSDGKAEKIAENVWGSHAPRAVYKYGGISYFTDKAIYIMDEETHASEEFAVCENVVDFVPKSGGAYALFGDGRLDVMIYSETRSQMVAEGVGRIFEALYMPERLTTYPISY